MKRKNNPPHAGQRLYNNLFINHTLDDTLKLVSEGLVSVKENAIRLVDDVQLLLKSRRFASARFILTTADEEIAKAYILLDMCRLDFRHESTLKRLCKAFYDHVEKHAYNEIHRYSKVFNMAHAKEIWEAHTIKWWPASPESGEPDMPHDTYFLREMPLYVDYIQYDERWFVPNDDNERFYFDKKGGMDSLSTTLRYLERLKSTYKIGLFEPRCLEILRDNFRKYYIKEDWGKAEKKKIYVKIIEKLVRDYSIPADKTIRSDYVGWPLYCFLNK